jgi:hypothetical protein
VGDAAEAIAELEIGSQMLARWRFEVNRLMRRVYEHVILCENARR